MVVASKIVNVDELIEEYVASLRAPSTQRAYAGTVGAFRRWADSRGLPLVEVEPIDLTRYFKDERDRGVSAATIQTRQGALSSFYAFVVACGLISVSPMDKVPRTKVRRYVAQPTLFTWEDARRLLNAIETRTDRDAVMLMLILLGGWKAQRCWHSTFLTSSLSTTMPLSR